MVRRCGLGQLIVLVIAACGATVAHAENPYLHDDFFRFVEWFPGQYDQYAVIAPVLIPALGEQVFLARQTPGGASKRQADVWVFALREDADRSAILMTTYRFKDRSAAHTTRREPQRLAALTIGDFTTSDGCEVFWQKQGAKFEGSMMQDACSLKVDASGKRIISNYDYRLTEAALSLREITYIEGDATRPAAKFRVHRKIR